MGAFFRTLFATIFANLILFILAIFVIAGLAATKGKTSIPDHATLHLRIPPAVMEYPSTLGQPFGDEPTTLHELRQNLRKAAVDKRIERVILSMSITDIGWASIDELRAEIANVKKAGKPVYAYLEWLTFRNYYLAAAADSIWMPDRGFVIYNGIDAQRMFRKSLWDKIGVVMRTHKIEAYKSAAETDTRTDLSSPARENAQWILDAQVARVREAIAKDREKEPAFFDSMLALVGPNPAEAAKSGFIDEVVYWGDIQDRFEGKDSRLGKSLIVGGTKYAKVTPAEVGLKGPTKVAIIHAQGAIAGDRSGDNPFLGTTMGAATVNKELRRVADDKSIDAVVFRVDSPGGATYTSDLIRREVAKLEAKKPLVVSMGDVAASGGYMISYPCSMLVANPMTRTGSIGSIFNVPYVKGLTDKLGLTFDGVGYGPHARIGSLVTPWTPEEQKIVEQRHWQSYNTWVEDIARVRGMTFAEVDSIGRGRVWTGEQAYERGLVDTLGTLDDAIAIAAAMAGGKPGEGVSETHYPKQLSFWEAVQAGEWMMAREALARTIWHDATEPVRSGFESLEIWFSGTELAVDEGALP
ncbi:MAG: signal peptide peptidase SppA [Candidatus Eiseniibacteriota bacterium]